MLLYLLLPCYTIRSPRPAPSRVDSNNANNQDQYTGSKLFRDSSASQITKLLLLPWCHQSVQCVCTIFFSSLHWQLKFRLSSKFRWDIVWLLSKPRATHCLYSTNRWHSIRGLHTAVELLATIDICWHNTENFQNILKYTILVHYTLCWAPTNVNNALTNNLSQKSRYGWQTNTAASKLRHSNVKHWI